MAKYRVETEDGKAYEVETEDSAQSATVPGMEKLGGSAPGAPKVPLPAALSATPSPGATSRRPTNQEVLGAPAKGMNAMLYGGEYSGRSRTSAPSDEYRDPSFNIPVVSGMAEGPSDIVHGAAQMGADVSPTEKKNGMTPQRNFLQGGTRMLSGVAKTGSAMIPEAMAIAPTRTLFGLGAGAVNAGLTYGGLKLAGADEDTANFGAATNGMLGGTAATSAGTPPPLGRMGEALWAGSKAVARATPMLGKGWKAASENFAKTAPDYVDPKVVAAAAKTPEARMRANAEARATVKAEGEAKLKADAEAKAVADKKRLTQTRAELAARGKGSDASRATEIPAQPPLPDATATPPADGLSPSGRLYGPRPGAPPTAPPTRTALWKGNQPSPAAPQMTPQQPATGQLPSGRIPGTGEPASAPPSPPARVPLWQRSAPVPNAPLQFTPQQPPVPQQPRMVVSRETPPVAPQPVAPAPPVAASGPPAPEGSLVIPPAEGRPSRYANLGGKLGEQVARDAHAKDTAIAKYLTDQGVTQGQFRMADAAQKAKWAREANPKYKGYTDPDRIDDLANMLTPDAPSGPALYKGNQQ